MKTPLTPAQARRIALVAQGFGRPRPASVGLGHIQRVIDRVGQFQIDSVNVAVRAQYMPLFARLGGYDRTLLDRAGGARPRRVFEYWGHAASLIDTSLQPALRHRMAMRAADPWMSVRRIMEQHPDLIDRIRQALATGGPLTAREIEHEEVRRRDHWGWNWSDVKHVLEWLFDIGELSVAGRNSQFERRYDLTERVLPSTVVTRDTPSPEESHLALVRRAAQALGIATDRCLADYFRTKASPTRAAIRTLLSTGELLPVEIGGWERPAYLWHEAALPRRVHTDSLVSPFDSLVFERERLLALFGVHYRIEIYTPPEQRRYGYYVYLFVMDEAIAARVDLKADRAASCLVVRASWLEPGSSEAETASRLARSVREMADWLGLTDVRVEPVGTLHQHVAHAL